MNFFKYTFQGFELDFKLLFIVIFLGIISWKGASRFNGGEGCFSDGGTSFLIGGDAPCGASVLMGGGFKKKSWDEGGCPPPMFPHYGKPWYITCLLLALIYLN